MIEEIAENMTPGNLVPAGADVHPVAAGTFVIYEDGKGGFVLVTDMPEQGGVRHQHIPRALIKMVTGGGGKLAALFGRG